VTLGSLQVHPGRQGTGLGRRLVAAAHDLAVAEFDAELALVQVRDGLGLDRFYARLGYVEVGRVPGGLAFEDGDRIDELTMVRRLP
jgi:predicted N-acetyltransferase YhbS